MIAASKQQEPARKTKTDPEPPIPSGHVTPTAVRIMPVMRSRLGVVVVTFHAQFKFSTGRIGILEKVSSIDVGRPIAESPLKPLVCSALDCDAVHYRM
jgi:hypothetical protein